VKVCTALLLLFGLAVCLPQRPCPTIAYAAGGVHSVTVAVSESLRTRAAGGRTLPICIRNSSHPSYDAVDRTDAEFALAESLAVDRKVITVVGHLRSHGSLTAASVYRRLGVPQIVPTGTSHQLRVAGPWTFVLAPSDSAQAEFLGAAVAASGARRVLLFYSGEEYGEGMAISFRSALVARQLVVAHEVRLGAGSDAAVLAEAAARRRDVDVAVILADFRQTGRIAKVLVALRPRLPLYASDGAMYAQGLRQMAGAAAESLRIVSSWAPDTTSAATREYLAVFRAITGREPTPSEALGHDALLYAHAAAIAVGPDRAGIRTWLAGPGGGTPPPGAVTAATLHHQQSYPFTLVRIGPPPTSPAPH
jgi:ABC-type branched-subunit amino acid transport system substrate-binding protein